MGSGAWACAAVRMAAQNTKENNANEYDPNISMWVYEEEYEGRKLTEVINELHENPKYLPGVNLGDNVIACPDLIQTVEGADLLILCSPHQFVRGICKQLAGKVKPGAIAISLIKGMRVRNDGPQLISQLVSRALGIDCSVLMGANIAEGIAREELSEAVIGECSLVPGRNSQQIVVSVLPAYIIAWPLSIVLLSEKCIFCCPPTCRLQQPGECSCVQEAVPAPLFPHQSAARRCRC